MNSLQMLQKVIKSDTGPFAILHRPEAQSPGWLEILIGETSEVAKLADIPLSERNHVPGKAQHDALVLIPHQQIKERGFVAAEDGTPLLVLSIAEQSKIETSEAMKWLPNDPIDLENSGFDIDDEAYTDIVHSVLENEIGTGAGSNFVIKRAFTADITNYSLSKALSLFRRLLVNEVGTYWTFIVHTGERTLVGATPERHISLKDGHAVMNPISGTYRYPADGPDLSEIMGFLEDSKETDELYMVLDEELKMMAQVCDGGGQVVGPFLREMAQLAHTEYYIEGSSSLDPRHILKETLLAPTVIGSPLENACRVVARYEPKGRGYYGGIVGLIGREGNGEPSMDSAILIRTADISGPQTEKPGHLQVSVGATLVRHSDAASEVAETHTKAAGILAALNGSRILGKGGKEQAPKLFRASSHPQIQDALNRRNGTIANFWIKDVASRAAPNPLLRGRKALVIDAEDNFTAMLAHQLRAIGLDVTVKSFDASYNVANFDLVVLGPGPGDPRDDTDPRMIKISAVINQLIETRKPFLSVCLSHQLLCRRLGLSLKQREVPHQGAHCKIDLFGMQRQVGFYNSYVAESGSAQFDSPGVGTINVSKDPRSDEIYALRGPHFGSIQFHVESVLTQSGLQILTELIAPLMATQEEYAL